MELGLREKVLVILRERGQLRIVELASLLGEDEGRIKYELDKLESEGLIRRRTKGLIIKSTVYELTPTGLEESGKAYEKLVKVANEINSARDQEQLDQLIGQYQSIIPLLIALNLVDAALLTSLMSQWMIEDQGGHDDWSSVDAGADVESDTF